LSTEKRKKGDMNGRSCENAKFRRLNT